MFKKKQREMVGYWKKQDSVLAKVYQSKAGHYEMQMQGEKYPFPGHPRGILLYGGLSPLKHNIKNQIFNEVWRLLEEKKSDTEIVDYVLHTALPNIYEISEKTKYDMLPPEKMVPAVREIERALAVVGKRHNSENTLKIKDILTFIIQEDDGYRFRVQWIAKFFRWYKFFRRNPLKDFTKALELLEHAEFIPDMKERIRLLRRVLLFALSNERIKKLFDDFFFEVDWKKVRLTKADKYFFRAKYFKVDYPEDEY